MTSSSGRFAFFRQSGWMMAATTVGGLFMWLVHVPAQAGLPPAEYGVFLALLQLLNLMLIPAIGLQMVFAQQAAAAIREELSRQLAHTVRRVLLGVSLIWLCMAVIVLGFRHELAAMLKIANPAALRITVGIGLATVWLPVMQGLLQGRQDFFWLGWSQILNGCGRFVSVLLIVGVLGGWAAGAMLGALIGFVVALVVSAWQTRAVWLAPGARLRWDGWVARVAPLSLGLSASQFMLGADQLLVQSIFDKDVTGLYGAAGMIGRGLVVFTAPLMAVMFPKIVASAARAERTNVLAQALGATALVGGLAALTCTIVPELPLRIVYKPYYWASAPLVPWFGWCMLPLTMANVLISNLLARERFAAVPWLVLVAAGYGAALMGQAGAFQAAEQLVAFKMVVRTIGVFSLLLLGVAAWFTWGKRAEAAPS